MDVIGLTGGIGTGKSTASAYLRKRGFAVINADQIARQIVEPGTPLLAELERTFGKHILTEEGSLDRKALATIVFADAEKRRQLDAMMHGRIIQVIQEQIQQYQAMGTHKGIVLDVPLLFETGLDKKCERTWLLTANRDIRIARVCARDSMSVPEVAARIRSQLDDEEKKRRADRVIDNSGTVQELERQMERLIQQECEAESTR